MGFFSSSKKFDDPEDYISNDKSVAHVIRSRFYGKNKGKERDGVPAPTFSVPDASAAQMLSNSTPPSSAPIQQSSSLSRNSNATRKAGANLRIKTETTPSTPPSAYSHKASPSTVGPPPSPTPSRVSSASGLRKQSTNTITSPLRQQSDNVTMTLAQRLNELAAANSQGLLNDDEYRLLRQNLFERFATSATVPTETPVVPVSKPRPRGTPASPQEIKLRPLSNFQVEVNRSPSIRSKNSMTSGVANFLRRATSRRTPAGSNDFSDTSSVFSSGSKTSIFKRALSKKSSASSVRTTTSRTQADTISISSRTVDSLPDHSHPPVSISRSNASIRRLATPPSSFPSRLPGEGARTSSFNADMLDDEHLETTAEIRQQILTVEAEARRLMDAFNGLEMTTLAKLQRHHTGRHILGESSAMTMSAPTTPRRIRMVDSDMTSLRSATSAASLDRSPHTRSRSKGGLGPLSSTRSGSLHRKNSSSSVGTEEGKSGGRSNPPPVPSLLAGYGRLGVGSVSNVSLARSHMTMSAVPEDEQALPEPTMEDGKVEDEMDDIQRRREEVSERYAARLEYLRAKLKGAQLREKLARK
ncbi:hypothetical protein H0H92_006553 [Tricholoma furcatifolium]|nr:hypothetical protein H0H92_006553 [Tricholoma furcatifolium]